MTPDFCSTCGYNVPLEGHHEDCFFAHEPESTVGLINKKGEDHE